MSPEWIAAFVVSIGTAIINKLWNRSSDNTKAKIAAAISEAKSIMTQCVLTARPGMTVDDMVVQLKGVAAIALGRIGIKTTDPLVGALVNAAIAEAVHQFVDLHPEPKSLTLPVHAKIAALAARPTLAVA